MLPDGFRILEHTADLRVEVRGRSLSELFATAARGMFGELIEGDPPEAGEIEREVVIALSAPDLLLREWLAELLFLHETEREYYTDFDVEVGDEGGLFALVRGVPNAAVQGRIAVEIKAVTYHDLLIEETDEGYRAEVIFDL